MSKECGKALSNALPAHLKQPVVERILHKGVHAVLQVPGNDWQELCANLRPFFKDAHPPFERLVLRQAHENSESPWIATLAFVPRGANLPGREMPTPGATCANIVCPRTLVRRGYLGRHENLEQRIATDLALLARNRPEDVVSKIESLIARMRSLPERVWISDLYNRILEAMAQGQVSRRELQAAQQQWTGSDFLALVPQNPNWSCWHRQEAVIEGVLVSEVVWGGAEECPYGDEKDPTYFGYQRGNSDFVLQNLRTGERVLVPSLGLHLIREHHFFQGLRSAWRLDPRKLLAVLELRASDSVD